MYKIKWTSGQKDWLQESQKSVGDQTKVLIFKVMMTKHFIVNNWCSSTIRFLVDGTLTKMG